jgi:hypothetical protein
MRADFDFPTCKMHVTSMQNACGSRFLVFVFAVLTLQNACGRGVFNTIYPCKTHVLYRFTINMGLAFQSLRRKWVA